MTTPYTANELAHAAGKTVRWIQILCQRGTIPSKRFGKKTYLIKYEDAQKYLEILKDITQLEADVRREAEINGEV